MTSLLLDVCPITGRVDTFDYDPVTKTSIITCTENVDAILDRNQDLYNDGMHKSARWRGEDNDFWFVGSIPLTTLHEWMIEFNKDKGPADWLRNMFATNNEEWDKFIQRKLDCSDNRKLKTAPVAWR